jgi:hypothetical protein
LANLCYNVKIYRKQKMLVAEIKKTPKQNKRSKKPKTNFDKMLVQYADQHHIASDQLLEIICVLSNAKRQEQKQIDHQRAFMHWMVGTAIGFTTTAIAAKHGINTAQKAAVHAANKHLANIQKRFLIWQQDFINTAVKLMEEFFFLLALLKDAKRLEKAARYTLKGLSEDVAQYVINPNQKSIKLQRTFLEAADNDPQLKKRLERIMFFADELHGKIKICRQLIRKETDLKNQKDEFLKNFYESFNDHILITKK